MTSREQSIKKTMDKVDLSKLKIFVLLNMLLKEQKSKRQSGKEMFTNHLHLEYIKNSQNSIVNNNKKPTSFKMSERL